MTSRWSSSSAKLRHDEARPRWVGRAICATLRGSTGREKGSGGEAGAADFCNQLREVLEMEMAVTELEGDVVCIRLRGRLDALGTERIAPSFTSALANSARHAAVDLSEVVFVSSLGIQLMIASARTQRKRGSGLVLFGARGFTREVMEQAAIDQIIPTVTTEQQALQRLRA